MSKDTAHTAFAAKTSEAQKLRRVALVGNPNSGKSSLFNALTGLNQKVGNFPGVTVDKRSGTLRLGRHQLELLDMPGTYSLYPRSADEQVVVDILLNPKHCDFPDVVVVVTDATNLRRNMLLFTQVADLSLPLVLVLNMADLAADAGIQIDTAELEARLGVPVVATNARKAIGLAALKEAILRASPCKHSFYDADQQIDYFFSKQTIDRLLAEQPTAYGQWLCLHLFERLDALSEQQKDSIQQYILHAKQPFRALNLQQAEVLQRYERIDQLLEGVIGQQPAPARHKQFTRRLDSWMLHPFWGYATFLLILFLIFQAIFSWASIPMDWIDGAFSEMAAWIHEQGGDSWWVSFFADGVLSGIGGIMVFVPQIAILFFFLGMLEETGYMARVAVLTDRLMRRFGLNGRSVVPLVSGVACAIPSIMAARTIPNPRERLITMMVIPLISCSARLPVYTVLIALAVPNQYWAGMVSLQGLTLMALYLIGTVASLLVAWLLSRFLPSGQGQSFFMLEMPLYRLPRWRNLLLTVWEKVYAFISGVAGVILVISIIIWILSSFGPGDAMQQAEEQLRAHAGLYASEAELSHAIAAARLEHSYAGYLGRSIEPLIRPLGYDWKIGIALISSFAAREVFVATISTIYSIGSEEELTIVQRLRSEINTHTGEPAFNFATSVSLMLFYAFAMQCMSTLAVMRRESNSWRYPLLQLGYMSGLAYVAAMIAYQLLS